jgi:hypothetical protein
MLGERSRIHYAARCVVGGGSECTAQDEQVQKDRLIDAGECEKVCKLLRVLYYIYTRSTPEYILECTPVYFSRRRYDLLIWTVFCRLTAISMKHSNSN